MKYTIKDLLGALSATLYKDGMLCHKTSKFAHLVQNGDRIQASMISHGKPQYAQNIRLFSNNGVFSYEGVCTCVGKRDCPHIAAVLIEVLVREQKKGATPAAGVKTRPTSGGSQCDLFGMPEAPAPVAPANQRAASTGERLRFVLQPCPLRDTNMFLCKTKATPEPGNASAFTTERTYPASILLRKRPFPLEPDDPELLGRFLALHDENRDDLLSIDIGFLQTLIEKDKLLWTGGYGDYTAGLLSPLRQVPARHVVLAWQPIWDRLLLAWRFAPAPGAPEPDPEPPRHITHVLPCDPPWHVDHQGCGEMLLPDDVGDDAAALLALVRKAAPLDDENAAIHLRYWCGRGLAHLLPVPTIAQQAKLTSPAVRLTLSLGCKSVRIGQDGSRLADPVLYDYARLVASCAGREQIIDFQTPANPSVPSTAPWIAAILEPSNAAGNAMHLLRAAGFSAPAGIGFGLRIMPGALVLPDSKAWFRFAQNTLPALEQMGCRIEKNKSYRYDVQPIDEWFAEIGEGDENSGRGGNAWFDIDLGIIVAKRRIALLPVLVELIKNAPQDFDQSQIAARADDDVMVVRLPGGEQVALPWDRIRFILSVLGELSDGTIAGDVMKIAILDAARLEQLASGGAQGWHWHGKHGAERLRALARRAEDFNGIAPVATPAGIRAVLREYQSEGLAWMQFLRQFDLAGVLADDMGLGKTIQTLAHIMVEKESGRLVHPVLVVAPTSLMGNWQEEAKRFAPSLRLLLLHGEQRLTRFEQMAQHDLVLTTYALLPRDQEILRAQPFHLLVLDEAQAIKNPRSKVAETACLLQARHRLCLTGTPVQNHVGELWSQFHFLMPGLLGTEKAFARDFRNPIEKQRDQQRSAFLTRCLKPFMLRRTKDKVARELPAKTEMVRMVELGGKQRDLYETVRLALHQKVSEEVQKKGLARSQIVILDALLKLRQVCCDPRLVKLEAAQKTRAGAGADSAKLDELLDMLDELLGENRKVLVFSQFTGMLALIAAQLQTRGIVYALLTGETKERAEVVSAFQNGAAPVFLISLRAGGVGLNLTAADTVIHYDPWWNPAVENQATDRAWRIGQDKPVFVYKLIARGTVEEKIQAMQRKKAMLADAILAGGELAGGAITAEDLQAIFAPLAG